MKAIKHYNFTAVIFTVLFSVYIPRVFAQQCSINLNYQVIIDPKHIRIVDNGQTKVQINGISQLFIEGREILLGIDQEAALEEFSSGVRQHFPKIVSITIEGADIVLKAINEMIGGLTGENSVSQQKFQAKLDELKWRIRARFNQSANNYFIAPQYFNDFDKIFVGELEQEIEKSVGTIFKVFGKSILNDAENSERDPTDNLISIFNEQIEGMSEELKEEVDQRFKSLEKKTSVFCHQLLELDEIENNLQGAIKQLNQYNLIKKNHP